jgi:hypothetical protein
MASGKCFSGLAIIGGRQDSTTIINHGKRKID